MPLRLAANRQFMIGNGLLAFAVIGVVVVFTILSLRTQRAGGTRRLPAGVCTVLFGRSLSGDTLTVYLNDSLLCHSLAVTDTSCLRVSLPAEHCALLVVDESTGLLSVLSLEEGNTCRLEKKDGKIVMSP